jgi:hypothetical protein
VLRTAEKFAAWQARKCSRQADRQAAASSHRVARLLHDRNRLIDAYTSRIRGDLLQKCSSDQLPSWKLLCVSTSLGVIRHETHAP